MTSESELFLEYKKIEKEIELYQKNISSLETRKEALKKEIKQTKLWQKLLCAKCGKAKEQHIFGVYCDTDENLDILNQRKFGDASFYEVKHERTL